MKNNDHRTVRRSLAFLLCFITLFSVLSFADGSVFQLATTASAAAETEPVVIEPTYTYKFDQKTYDSLLKQLNTQLKKKKFSKLANTFLREILYNYVKNYPQWKNVYSNLPSTTEFIKDNLINVIPYVQKLKMIDRDTEQGRILGEKAGWQGLTTPVSGGSSIRVFYRNPESKNLDHYRHLEDLQSLAHELRHVRDRAVKKKDYSTLFTYKMISDGATSFHERFLSPMMTYPYGDKEKVYTKKDAYVVFQQDFGTVYPYYQSFYEGLVYLAGYSTVNAVGQGKPYKTIKQTIAKRYGSETASSVWKILNALPDEIDLGHAWLVSNKAVSLSTEFFQTLLKCIKTDIQNLNLSKPNVIRKYMDIYRNIKLKVLPDVFNAKKINVNSKYFNTKELNSLLVEKVIASKALPALYSNPKWTQQAILEILYCDKEEYETTDDYPCYLPATIAQTTYTFSMEDGKPMVFELFKDEDDSSVGFFCKFDENGNISRTGDFMYF